MPRASRAYAVGNVMGMLHIPSRATNKYRAHDFAIFREVTGLVVKP